MSHVSQYEEMDKKALHDALLALHTCPHCRSDLQPVALYEDVWGCHSCKETWYLPKDDHAYPSKP